jgi:hypothetical protein
MPKAISSSVFRVQYQMDRRYCGRKAQTLMIIMTAAKKKAPPDPAKCVAADLPHRIRSLIGSTCRLTSAAKASRLWRLAEWTPNRAAGGEYV